MNQSRQLLIQHIMTKKNFEESFDLRIIEKDYEGNQTILAGRQNRVGD